MEIQTNSPLFAAAWISYLCNCSAKKYSTDGEKSALANQNP